jgi:uncharacterized membrane protein HdeD (DUF308 family)
MLDAETRKAAREVGALWWVFLLIGLAWIVVSIVVLQLNLTSVKTVGVLLGAIFFASAAEEFFVAVADDSWRWLRVLLGLLFVAGAIWTFVNPVLTFVSLAAALGFLLVFKGTLDLVGSIASQDINPVWWLGLIAGLLELGLGFWAAQQYFPARAVLMLLWVGFYSMFRGISAIVFAFEVQKGH